jgi:cysteinyl-tRNA synthetase
VTLRLYNTLTRRIEPFEPLHPPRVTMYTCGPTVWNYAHIGNFRSFLAEELLRRYLESQGYDVFQVMNLTDVDDRTIEAARKAGVGLAEHTEPYARAFFEDRDYLRIRPAHVYPRATQYVKPMIELVQALLDRGLAYRGEDGSVYYAVSRFPSYGRLSQLEKRALQAGARVASDEYSKEDVRDFALWKAATEADEGVGAAWDAPFGRGRPGWHLECSAMALQEIGRRFGVDTLDVHAGGVDNIFPHHENEIAQSEGATGRPFARYWMHGEFLLIKGTKMSKRYGNILTVRDLEEEGVDPAAFRLLVFGTHYRQQLNFDDDALEGAVKGVRRLGELASRLEQTAAGGATPGSPPAAARELERAFTAHLDDDLNAPRAVAELFEFVTAANRALDRGVWRPGEVRAALEVFRRVEAVLDVLPSSPALDPELEQLVTERIAARDAARRNRDFRTADAIRTELASRGIELEDTPQGTRWRWRGGR